MISISTLLQMDTLQKILFNTVLVSIPEEFYLVMFVLILVGEFEYWEEAECKLLIHRFDCVRLLVPTVVGALLSNVFRYGGIEFGMASLIPPLVFFILIVLTNDIYKRYIRRCKCIQVDGKGFCILYSWSHYFIYCTVVIHTVYIIWYRKNLR